MDATRAPPPPAQGRRLMDATRTPPPTGKIVELKPGEKAEPLGFVPLTSEQGEKILAKLDEIAGLLRALPGEMTRGLGFGATHRTGR